MSDDVSAPGADLAWNVRAWGRRVLAEARPRLAPRYPTCAEFRTLAPGGPPFEPRPRRLLEPDAAAGVDAGEFDAAYLGDRRNPRWVATPTVAYLWARMTIGTRTSGVGVRRLSDRTGRWRTAT